MDMPLYNDALIYLNQSLKIFQATSSDKRKDSNVASTLNNIGNCLMDMHRYEEALSRLRQSLGIYKTISTNQKKMEMLKTLSITLATA